METSQWKKPVKNVERFLLTADLQYRKLRRESNAICLTGTEQHVQSPKGGSDHRGVQREESAKGGGTDTFVSSLL